MRRSALLRLAAPLLALVGAAASPARAQVFNYLAMGDSITYGYFDEEDGNINNKGGYPTRLAPLLGCNGSPSSCEIYNEGVGGNTTAQMLSRVNAALNARPYDAMLLMGGTNDIFQNTSNETIEFNLSELYNRATVRGVDTVFASIIHFHPNGIHGTSKDAQVQDLRSRVIGLASQRSGYMADNWPQLCTTGGCFSTHYYPCVGNPKNPPLCGQPPPGGGGQPVDPVGHPDASGYQIMATIFDTALTFENLPGVPVPTSPSGTVPSSPTTYTWNRDPGNRATWYELEIDGPSGTVYSKWHEARLACGAGVCNVSPGVALGPGSYSFRVRGRTPRGRGGWSGDLQFNILSPPPTPVLIAPVGPRYSVSPISLAFEWNESENADSYELRVENAAGKLLFKQTFSAQVCSGSTCEATPSWMFAAGEYRWQMRALNAGGGSVWSGRKTFAVVDSPPAVPDPGYPDREIFNTNPRYSWTGAEYATYYVVEVHASGGGKLFERTFQSSPSCVGMACFGRSGVALAPDDYTWKVASGNPIGESAPSANRAFTVLPCTPMNRNLQNQVVTSTQLLRACETITAGNLGAGPYVVGAGGRVTLHAGGQVRLEAGFSVLSGGELTLRVDP